MFPHPQGKKEKEKHTSAQKLTLHLNEALAIENEQWKMIQRSNRKMIKSKIFVLT
jgi:primase-polymerase (primpol)-like protein